MKVNVKGVPSYQLEWKFVKGVEKVPVPCLLHTPSQTYIPNWLLVTLFNLIMRAPTLQFEVRQNGKTYPTVTILLQMKYSWRMLGREYQSHILCHDWYSLPNRQE